MQIVLLLVCLLAPTLAQHSMYTVKNYPDPIDRYEACGRTGPSFVCDPTGVLPARSADAIDNLLQDIYNETTVPCYPPLLRGTRRKGYLVMVAVMPKMERFFTVNTTGYSMQTKYREAQYFSYYLGQANKWGKHSSDCQEMVIILYSVQDDVLYTSTQSTARRKLTDSNVENTVMTALIMHYPFNTSNRQADVIKYLVMKYGEYLREDVATA